MDKTELSASESLIMKVIWDADGEISVPEMMKILKDEYGKDYARTTIATVLLRLSDKRFVTTRRMGKISYVTALKSLEDYRKEIARKNTDFWFKGSALNFISALHSTGSLTKEDRKKIQDFLNSLND